MTKHHEAAISLLSNSPDSNRRPDSRVVDRRKSRDAEYILDVMGRGKGTQYLVKWRGLGEKHNSWEKCSDMHMFKDMISHFSQNRIFERAKNNQMLQNNPSNHYKDNGKYNQPHAKTSYRPEYKIRRIDPRIDNSSDADKISDKSFVSKEAREKRTVSQKKQNEVYRPTGHQNYDNTESQVTKRPRGRPPKSEIKNTKESINCNAKINDFINPRLKSSRSEIDEIPKKKFKSDPRTSHNAQSSNAHTIKPKHHLAQTSASKVHKNKAQDISSDQEKKDDQVLSQSVSMVEEPTNRKQSSAKKISSAIKNTARSDEELNLEEIANADEVSDHVKLNNLIYFSLKWNDLKTPLARKDKYFTFEEVQQANPRILAGYLRNFIKFN